MGCVWDDDLQLTTTWNPKQPFINGCFSWMIPNINGSRHNLDFLSLHPFGTFFWRFLDADFWMGQTKIWVHGRIQR